MFKEQEGKQHWGNGKYGICPPVPRILDMGAPLFAIAYGISRIGCFLAGCCGGKQTSFILAMKFPNYPNPVHPTQLYAALSGFLMALLLFIIERYMKYDGALFVFFLLLYSIYRYFIEFYRRGMDVIAYNTTSGQIGSVIIIIFALIYIITKRVITDKDI